MRPEKYSENGISNITSTPKLESIQEQSTKDKESSDDVKGDEAKENLPCFLPALDVPTRKFPPPSDKRKLNDVKRRKAESCSDSSSSDDEIKELCSYGIPKHRVSSSRPPDKIAVVSSSFVICPRRRNRGPSPRLHTVQRPSINFDRMQQVVILTENFVLCNIGTEAQNFLCHMS